MSALRLYTADTSPAGVRRRSGQAQGQKETAIGDREVLGVVCAGWGAWAKRISPTRGRGSDDEVTLSRCKGGGKEA